MEGRGNVLATRDDVLATRQLTLGFGTRTLGLSNLPLGVPPRALGVRILALGVRPRTLGFSNLTLGEIRKANVASALRGNPLVVFSKHSRRRRRRSDRGSTTFQGSLRTLLDEAFRKDSSKVEWFPTSRSTIDGRDRRLDVGVSTSGRLWRDRATGGRRA